MEGLRDRWEHLFDSGKHTLFQSFAWNLLAARRFSDRAALRTVLVESQGSTAIIPACATHHQLFLLGDELFDYRDVLTVGDESATARAWREVATLSLPLGVTALRASCTRQHWQEIGLATEPFVNAPCVLRSDVDPNTFVARHNRSGRLLRRLARQGVAVRRHNGTNRALVREIYEKKALQDVGDGVNLFADAARRDFLVAVAAISACDIFALESAATLVAAIVTFRDGDTRRFYTTYYDHAWAHFSPGVALLFEATRLSLAEGLDCDYMTGGQTHKTRFATSSVPLYRAHATVEQLASAGYTERMAAA